MIPGSDKGLRLQRGLLVLLTPHRGVSRQPGLCLRDLRPHCCRARLAKPPSPPPLRKDAELRLTPRAVCWPRASCVWSKRFMTVALFCNYILLIKDYINWWNKRSEVVSVKTKLNTLERAHKGKAITKGGRKKGKKEREREEKRKSFLPRCGWLVYKRLVGKSLEGNYKSPNHSALRLLCKCFRVLGEHRNLFWMAYEYDSWKKGKNQ